MSRFTPFPITASGFWCITLKEKKNTDDKEALQKINKLFSVLSAKMLACVQCPTGPLIQESARQKC